MIELSKVSKVYTIGNDRLFALNKVDLSISKGEFVAIMGPSGSGKSTLLNIIGLLDRVDEGSFKLFNQEIQDYSENDLSRMRGQVIGFIFQQFNLLKRATARNNVSLPHLYYKSEQARSSEESLKIVGLGERLDHKSNELSGGQQQRVAIARALVNNPKILFADEPTGNLDSKSEQEILDILKDLHRQGMTIVMVTHEEEVSKIASRVIRMRDGEIVSDTQKSPTKTSFDEPIHMASKTSFDWAFIGKIIAMGFNTIFANKARSILSMLGILIGVAAVIAMLAIGKGAQESIEDQFSGLGTNVLTVSPGASRRGPPTAGATSLKFNIDDARAIEKIPGVAASCGTVSGSVRVIYGNKNHSTSATGVDACYQEILGNELALGRFFTSEENRSRARVALVGLTIVRELFGNENPIGASIKLNKTRFQIIGVLKEKGSNGFRDEDDLVMIPLQTAMKRLLGKTNIDNIQVKVSEGFTLDTIDYGITQLIIKRFNLKGEAVDSFHVRNMAGIREALSGTTEILSILLAIIAAISLVVGGIGIMNIMLVSVTERTREIGLRKAIGATSSAILIQFLIESVIISLTGGIIGILLGLATTSLVTMIFGWKTSVTTDSILLSTIFSVSVGVIFGIWPAMKAAECKPIEALRYE